MLKLIGSSWHERELLYKRVRASRQDNSMLTCLEVGAQDPLLA